MLVTDERQYTDEGENDYMPNHAEDSALDADAFESKSKHEPPTIGQRIWRFFFKSALAREEDQQTRMLELEKAIETYPDAAVNYLLRGELFLDMRDTTAAQLDFEDALVLVEEQYQTDRWGIAAQAIRDRALQGLQQIR